MLAMIWSRLIESFCQVPSLFLSSAVRMIGEAVLSDRFLAVSEKHLPPKWKNPSWFPIPRSRTRRVLHHSPLIRWLVDVKVESCKILTVLDVPEKPMVEQGGG